MVRLVSVPQHAVDRATTTLQEGIDGAAKILDELNEDPSPASPVKSPLCWGWPTCARPAAWPAPSSPMPSCSTITSPGCTRALNRSRMPAATMWTTRRVRCWQPGPSY